MQAKILVVEDEISHQLIIKKALGEGFFVDVAGSVEEARLKLKAGQYDLFVLDIMLPDGEGYDVCTEIKMDSRYGHHPIIFLTSKEDINSKVLGFSLGADDYVVKPCNPIELKARVDSKLKKHRAVAAASSSMSFGDLQFEVERQSVLAKGPDGHPRGLDLTPLEFKLIYFLAKNADHALSRGQIISGVWGEQTNVLDRSVDTYVASLRKKLGSLSGYIKSIHGVGYKFNPEAHSSRYAS